MVAWPARIFSGTSGTSCRPTLPRFQPALSRASGSAHTTAFIAALFEGEAGGLFDVRTAILGHLQQGGNPTPFDQIHTTGLDDHVALAT